MIGDKRLKFRIGLVCRAKRRRDQHTDLPGDERRKRHFDHILASKLSDHARERLRLSVLAAEGRYEKQCGIPRSPAEIVDELERLFVRPLHVLQNKNDRTLARTGTKALRGRGKDALTLEWIAERASCVRIRLDRVGKVRTLRCGEQWPERAGRLVLCALCDDDLSAGAPSCVGEFSDQSALSHAGRPGKQHEPEPTVGGLAQRVLE
ncbi:MAG TPA: hypothetical protein VF833_07350 [Gaiellaceae bacterium]